jgi:hypothetical protein
MVPSPACRYTLAADAPAQFAGPRPTAPVTCACTQKAGHLSNLARLKLQRSWQLRRSSWAACFVDGVESIIRRGDAPASAPAPRGLVTA